MGEEILLVLHSAGVRFAGAARFLSRDGEGAIILHVEGSWRQVDARTGLRFPCAHPAELTLDGFDTPWPATIVDISSLGTGVTLKGRPESSAVRMSVEHNGRHATLDCRVVAAREVEGLCALSLVFEGLNDAQQRFVDDLYDHYHQVFMEALPLAG
jgi:hypothetical protein